MALLPLLDPAPASNAPTGARSSSAAGVRAGAPHPEPIDAHAETTDSGAPADAAPAPGTAPAGDAERRPDASVLVHGPEASLLALGLATVFVDGADPGELDAAAPLREERGTPRVVAPGDPRFGAMARSAAAPDAPRDRPPASAGSAPRAESAGLRLVERGVLALHQQRGGTLVMRLSPPELGVLVIRMTLEAGRMEVRFEPSSAAARQLLDGNLGMLRQSLERHGVGVGRLVVEPPTPDRAEESARLGVGHSFDAGGRESTGRQEAERELRWRTEAGLLFGRPLRPDDSAGTAAEGRSSCPPSSPAPPPRISSPVDTAS